MSSDNNTNSNNATAAAVEPSKDDLQHNFKMVQERLAAATAARQPPFDMSTAHHGAPRLVAVGKTKSARCLADVYEVGQRAFGENYVQELIEKVPLLPQDIEWHFIGHLQSNKASLLVESVPNLTTVETVDSEKLAKKLNAAVQTFWTADNNNSGKRLRVFVQVNTSGEESKSGVEPTPGALLPLVTYIVKECPRLEFCGLMTIGMPDYTSRPENFECLWKCREMVASVANLGLDVKTLELSMGMSGDFEAAVAMGSTNVRVGSTIFGPRNYSVHAR